MTEQFLHGVNVIEVTSGARTVQTAKSSVIGVIGTAPDADGQKFPLNKPILIAGSLKEAAKLGKSGTLPSAVNGIFSQIGATVVVIRVEESDPKLKKEETLSNVIGGVDKETGDYQGIQAFLSSESIVHVAPRILIAPQFTHQLPEDGKNPVVAALISVAEKLRSIIVADGPNTNDEEAIKWRKSVGSSRVYVVDPWVKVLIEGKEEILPPSSFVAGLIAKIDSEQGFWHSPSNKEINGIVGTSRPIDFTLGDTNCRANHLNENEVTTIIHQNGYRLWGNRTCSNDSKWAVNPSGRRVMYWQGETGSINNLLSQSLGHLRSRSRDMVRKNPYAANIIDTIVSNSIGTGIKPQSKARDGEFRKKVQELWLKWTDEADSSGISDFYGLQALVCRSMIEGGECFVRLRTRKLEDGFSVPLQLQVLESEHLDNKTNQTLGNGNVIRNGIEFNRLGQREAYYLFKEHPGESTFGESVRVPANDVLHIYRPLRPGQIRGEPWLSNILLKLYELDQYDDAELVRKKTAAMFAGFITRLDPEANIMGESESNEQGVALSGLEPGTMQLLDPGEDIKFSEPSDVGGSYEAFMRQQLRAIAIGTGITYEQLTGDLTGVNYSSIRAGMIEFRRRCAMLQHNIMVFQFCRPVWSRWLELAVLSGKLSTDGKVVKAAKEEVKWIPQGFDWVDPLKDQQAQQMAVRNGFKSRSEVVSEMGYDVEEIDQEIAEDQKRADSFNLLFDSDVRTQTK